MADSKLNESYIRRDDEELDKWIAERAGRHKQAEAEKAAKAQAGKGGEKGDKKPKKDEESGGLLDTIGGALSTVGKPIADLIQSPTQPAGAGSARTPVDTAPSVSPQGLVTPANVPQPGVLEALQTGIGDIAGRIGDTVKLGREQMEEARTGKTKEGKPIEPLKFGQKGTGTQPGMEPEQGQDVPRFTSEIGARALTGTMGFFNTFTPIITETFAHGFGEMRDWLHGGNLTDEFVKAQLDFARLHRDKVKGSLDTASVEMAEANVKYWEGLLLKPQPEREAQARQDLEMVGALTGAGLTAGPVSYVGMAASAGKILKGAMKGGAEAAEAAGRAGVAAGAEAAVRAATETPEQAAARAQWAKAMQPKMLQAAPPEVEAAARAIPVGPSSLERPPIMSASTTDPMKTARDIGEGAVSPLEQGKAAMKTPDIQEWAAGIMQKVRAAGEADDALEGQLRESVRKQSKLLDPQGRPIAGGSDGQAADDIQFNLAVSRAALGGVLGALNGEDPETALASAVAGAFAGVVAPSVIKQMAKGARVLDMNTFEAGRESIRHERATAEMAKRAAAGGMTYSPRTKKFVDDYDGYAVSVAPERTKTIRGRDATAKDFQDFIKKNADYLDDERAHVGAWKDDEGTHLDISVLTKDQAEAMGLGTRYKQKAIFDYKNKADIRVPKGPHGDLHPAGELSPDELRAADEYDKAIHDPAAKPAWDELIAETEKLYDDLLGSKKLTVEVVEGKQPYSSLEEMLADLEKGKLKVSDIGIEHPFWSREQNLKFRAVHDYLGHLNGADFSLAGEYKAFQAQAQHLKSDAAKRALQTEVYGQAASFYKNRSFGEQKAFLPKENLNLPPFRDRLAGGAGEIAEELPEAKVTLRGYQPGYEDMPGFELFNLDEAIPGHPKGSTISAASIEEAGYRLPAGIENALAPRSAADTAEAAMGTGRAMTDEASRAALEQMRKNDAILEELRAMRESGEFPREYIETLYLAHKRAISGGSDAPVKKLRGKLPKTAEALELIKKGLGGHSWYRGAPEELQKWFGKDWELVADALAVASPVGGTDTMMELALEAFMDYKMGLKSLKDIEETFGSPSAWAKKTIPRIFAGEKLEDVMKARAKVWNFAKAIKGDLKAVVIDTWMWRLFYPDEYAKAMQRIADFNATRPAGTPARIGGYTGTQSMYLKITDWMHTQAAKMGVEPAELQAALWWSQKMAAGSEGGTRDLRAIIESVMQGEKGKSFQEFLNATDWWDDIKGLGTDQAGRTNIALNLLMARAVVGGTLGSLMGDDAESMAKYSLMGAGIGSVASGRILQAMKRGLNRDNVKGLEELTGMLRAGREAGISGGAGQVPGAFIPKSVFGETVSQAVPPKDLKQWTKGMNDKLSYARRIADAMYGLDDEVSKALRSNRFQNVEDVFKLDPATVATEEIPEVVQAARGMRAFVMEDLLETTARAKLLNTPEAAADVARKFAYAGRYAQRVSDMEAALGRGALHIERMQATIDMDTLVKELAQAEAAIGGAITDNKTLVEMISRTHERSAIAKLAEQGSRWPKALWSIYYGLNLLSSPLTHVKNIIGNGGALMMAVTDRAVGEFVIHPMKMAVGLGKGGVQFGETYDLVTGIWQMVGDSFRAGKKGGLQYGKEAFWTGESLFGRHTKAAENLRLLSARALEGELEGPAVLGKLVDTMSGLAQYNLRFMEGTDEFFKMLTFTGELRAQARREARRMGLSGKELNDEITKLIDRPTTEMLREAQAAAHENTFTKAFAPGTAGAWAQGFAQTPYMRVGLTPFFRTPSRIAEFSMVHTPGLNLVAKQFYSDLFAGGAKAELATAKLITGLAIAGYVFHQASAGYITGDWPKDANLRASYERAKWQPRSIYNPINGKYYSYAGLAPLDAMLAGAANFAIAWPHLRDGDIDTIVKAHALAYGNTVTDSPYLSAASDIGDIIGGMERFDSVEAGLKLAQKRMLALMPGASLGRSVQKATGQGRDATEFKTVAEAETPEQRELNTLWGEFLQQVPGYGTLFGKGLPAKTNYLTGEAVNSESGWLGFAFPYQVTTNPNDPVANKIVELGGCRLPKELIRVLGGNMPRDSVIVKDGDPREGVLLTDAERAEFGKILAKEVENADGEKLYEALTTLIASDEFKGASSKRGRDSVQSDMIHNTFREYFEEAERIFKERHPEVANIIERRALERQADRLPSDREDEREGMMQDLLERQAEGAR